MPIRGFATKKDDKKTEEASETTEEAPVKKRRVSKAKAAKLEEADKMGEEVTTPVKRKAGRPKKIVADLIADLESAGDAASATKPAKAVKTTTAKRTKKAKTEAA